MTVLPQEVWELVVSYIPRRQRLTLVSVNRPLFNIVLNERYRAIEWVKLDAQTAHYLVRLQDRDIARRVRRLHIRAWFLQYLLKREKLFHQTAHDTRFYGLKKRMSRLFKIAPKAPVVATSKQIALVNRLGELASWKEILRAMNTAIGHMVNVTQYKFEWGDIVLDENTQPLLLATWRAFDTNLSKLVLHARVSQFEDLLSITPFRSLEELELHFDFDPNVVGKHGIDILTKNETIFVNSVAPFINDLGSTLRSLIISSSAKGDHTAFLRALRPLPKLRTFALRISFHNDFLSDTTPISQILHTHSTTLSKVELRPSRPTPMKGLDRLQPRNSGPAWLVLAKQCLSQTQWLTALDSLTVPALDHATTLALISYTPSSLRSLCLVDRFLEVHEVAEIIGVLGQRPGLRNLSIEVTRLKSELLTLLANALPELYSLTLILGIDLFFYEPIELKVMGYQPLSEWSLFDLSIFLNTQRDESLVVIPCTGREEHLMQCLSLHVLPRLRSFKGRGHKILMH